MSRKSKPPIALYSALADTTRCRILEILKAAPTPVHVLTEAFSISRPAISRHLRVLKSAGLVAEVKKGRENVYAFRPAKLDAARTWLETIRSAATPAEEPVEASPPAPAAKTPAAPKPARTPRQKPAISAEKPA
ncbi:MAG TPA: metalloregulator ArsR/SmtB family transcription factor, partial [Devosia sp.]|nr:metalloregulator ArsR/SmtB family transcription factor [Devosia sp.]